MFININTVSVLAFAALVHAINADGECADVDTDACKLMEHNKPDLCDSGVGETACPRYCGKCPLECFSCSDLVQDLSQCNQVTYCVLNQTCYSMEVFDFDQSHGFRGGCISKELCVPHGGQPQVFGRSSSTVHTTCCDSDRCNGQPTTTSTTTTTTTTPTTTAHHFGSHCYDNDPHAVCSHTSFACNLVPLQCKRTCGLCCE